MKFSKIKTSVVCIFLSVCLMVAFSGCDSVKSIVTPPLSNIEAQNLMAGIEKTDVTLKEPDDYFVESVARFSFELFANEFDEEQNILVSPLSVIAALAMAQNGADGKTLSQMERLLGGIPADDMNAYLGAYLKAIAGEESELKTANSMWLGDGKITADNAFLQKNASFFDSEIYSADFSLPGTVRDINSWVKNNTDGMIEKIVNDISDDTMMFLINALSFDAKWTSPYTDNCVHEGVFTNQNGEKKSVSYMYSEEYRYIQMDNAKGFVKSYEGGRFSFAAVLPDEGIAIGDFIKNLDGRHFVDSVMAAQDCTVLTQMPKFKAEYANDLNETLISMGMKDAFDDKKADFSRMGTTTLGLPLFISRVIHKTYIEVAEEGTRAGAVTAIIMDAASAPSDPPPEVRLTRPFVYAIIDNATGLPIFIGAQLDVEI